MLVVGGGIGGLTVALSLALVGREVRVLEAAPELSEIGAGIQLAPNATRRLDAFGVLDELSEKAVFPKELVYMDAVTGKRITAVDLGEPFLARYGHPYIVIHRSDLHAVILAACERRPQIEIETSRRVVSVSNEGDSALAVCADGSTHRAAAIVAADGLHSVVREQFVGDELQPTPHVAYRGAIPIDEVSPHAGADSMVMWVGPDLHLVQYKLRGGELYNQVGVFKSRTFGLREDYGGPDELDEHFGRCCEEVAAGAALLGRQQRWPMADRAPIGNWTWGRVCLLGDAAHAMLQYVAQGGCQAIEDAASLARSFGASDSVEEAFAAYQAERVPRSAEVQRTARRFGEACHLDGVGKELRNHVFSQRTPQDYGPFDWLYEPVAGAEPEASLAPLTANGNSDRKAAK